MKDNSLFPFKGTSLSYIINMFPEDISDVPEWISKEFHFNRLNERFQLPYNYADLIINGNVFSHNKGRKYYSFLYDMNKLFEQFIANLIKRNSSTIFGLDFPIKNIQVQKESKNFLYKGDEATRKTILDILVELPSHKKIIIDTKYQIMGDSEDSNEDDSKNPHLYQLFTYSKLYKADLALIIYPLEVNGHAGSENEGINDSGRNRETYTFEKGGSTKFKMCGIPMDLSGDRKIWENRLVKNLRECLCD